MHSRPLCVFVGASSFVILAQPSSLPAAPCACNSDVSNNGSVQFNDVAIVFDCVKLGNCAGCVNDCDVDCDGDVDYYDIGVVSCRFQDPFNVNCCSEPDGACTKTTNGPPGPPCVLTTADYCSLFVGTWHGNDSFCVGDVVVPTVSAWGMAAMTLGTLIAATIVLQRRRAVLRPR